MPEAIFLKTLIEFWDVIDLEKRKKNDGDVLYIFVSKEKFLIHRNGGQYAMRKKNAKNNEWSMKSNLESGRQRNHLYRKKPAFKMNERWSFFHVSKEKLLKNSNVDCIQDVERRDLLDTKRKPTQNKVTEIVLVLILRFKSLYRNGGGIIGLRHECKQRWFIRFPLVFFLFCLFVFVVAGTPKQE